MAYATSLENFMRQELRNFDMCNIYIQIIIQSFMEYFFTTFQKKMGLINMPKTLRTLLGILITNQNYSCNF